MAGDDGKIDYTLLALPKGGRTPAQVRAAARARMFRAARPDKEGVWARQGGRCFASGIAPVCLGVMHDPHELIPVSAGGPRESWNRVGLCRACHRACQKTLGGVRLYFYWRGDRPNADVPGDVWCEWRDRSTRAWGSAPARRGVSMAITGKVARLVSDKGFGFVRGEDGLERFFHRSACVRGTHFENLSEGDEVRFEHENGPKGPRAIEVEVIE